MSSPGFNNIPVGKEVELISVAMKGKQVLLFNTSFKVVTDQTTNVIFEEGSHALFDKALMELPFFPGVVE